MSPTLAAVDVAVTGVLRHRGQRRSADVDGCRWTPTTYQIRIHKDLYFNNSVRSPTAEQIQRISAKLRQYGKIEGKNVFYWFQNHKARERQKKRFTSDIPMHHRPPLRRRRRPPHLQQVLQHQPCYASSSASSATSLVNVGSYGYVSVAMERSFQVLANAASIVTIAAYKYQWVASAAEEIASLAFYAIIFYMFRPIEKNEYFALDEDEESTAEMALKYEEFEL
ncbi:hypothetical protein OROMI_019579 [Orobanche minor]